MNEQQKKIEKLKAHMKTWSNNTLDTFYEGCVDGNVSSRLLQLIEEEYKRRNRPLPDLQ